MREICLVIALRYVGDRATAEDVAQEATARAWRHRAKLRDPAKRDAWLRTIVRNEASRLRARHNELHLEAEPLSIESMDWADRAAERLAVKAALGALDELDREIVRLRYEDDLTQIQIARRLKLPEGTVKIRLHRARTRLRGHLG